MTNTNVDSYRRRLWRRALSEAKADFGRSPGARMAKLIVTPGLTVLITIWLSQRAEPWERIGITVLTGIIAAALSYLWLIGWNLLVAAEKLDAELRAQLPPEADPPEIEITPRVFRDWKTDTHGMVALACVRCRVARGTASRLRGQLKFWGPDGTALLDGEAVTAAWRDRGGAEAVWLEDGPAADLMIAVKRFSDMVPFVVSREGAIKQFPGTHRLPVDPLSVRVQLLLRAEAFEEIATFELSHSGAASSLELNRVAGESAPTLEVP